MYRTPSLSYGLKITKVSVSLLNYAYDVSIHPNNSFFGMYSYSFQNNDFQYNLVTYSGAAYSYGTTNLISIRANILSFHVGSCCLDTPWEYVSNSSCVAICPSNRTYTDNTSMTCKSCPYDCY